MKFLASLALLCLFSMGCQHAPVGGPKLVANPLYGSFAPASDTEAQVVVVPQWHLPPQLNTKTSRETPPQTENQLSIYYQLSEWIQKGSLQNVVSEGCEGEIDDNYTERFNGWTLKDLKELTPEQLDTAVTLVGLKLKAKYGDKLRVTCGDDLSLIKKQQLILSDLRGLSGFKLRLAQFHDDATKRQGYLETVRSVLKLPPSTTEADVNSTINHQLREKLEAFDDLILLRNEAFVRKAQSLQGRSAIVIGTLHSKDLEEKLRRAHLPASEFTPSGLKGDEGELNQLIKKLLEVSSKTQE